MTYPVDVYSVGSGQSIYGGRHVLPAWVPAPGVRANVSLNTVASQFPVNAPDPRTRGSSYLLTDWVSTTYVPVWGKYGSIIIWGGGHDDYLGNEMYRYDIETRMVSRVMEPFDIPVALNNNNSTNEGGFGVGDLVYGEFYTDDTKTATVQTEKVPTHTYDNVKWVPGSIVGNTLGWYVVVGNFNKQIHYVDLDNPSSRWHRFGPLLTSTGKTENPSYGCSFVDTKRNIIGCFPYGNGNQQFFYSMTVPGAVLTTPYSDYMDSQYAVASYDVADDLYLVMSVIDPTIFKVYNPNNTIKYSPPTSGTAPAAGHGTVGWIESTRQLYYWDGAGNTVFFLTAPANPTTGTWVWTSRTFTGDPPVVTSNNTALHSRLHYVAGLNSLVHMADTSQPAQLWRL